jgi:nucleotide-binding universal stress UspA family protein
MSSFGVAEQEGDMFNCILIPIDIAEPKLAKAALDKATTIGRLSKARLMLLYVRSLVPMTYMEFAPPDFDQIEESRVRELLGHMAANLDYPQERISTSVRLGSVYAEVLAAASDIKVDLIVIGSQRPTMASYLIGSNAKTIVRHAMCSVLVVREGVATA